MSFLTELKRRLSQQPLQQPRQAWDEQGPGQTPLQRIASGIPVVNEPSELNGIGVANDVGISGRSNRPSDVIRPQQQPQRRSLPYGIQEIPNAPYDPDPLSKIQPIPNADPNEPLKMQLLRQQGQRQTYSQNINPTVRPQPQPAAQGNWRDLVKQGVTPNTVLNRYAKPNVDETTQLNPQDEAKFQQWVKDKKVPWQDSPFADYDMRGYYQAQQGGDPNAKQNLSGFDQTMHFPDTYKTKYHKTFSNESKYATPNAPSWQGDRLVDEKGNVVADETPQAQPSAVMNGVKRAVSQHPPLGEQPPRPAGVPANAHFDPNPYGGEWIAPDDGKQPAPTAQPQQQIQDFSPTRDRRTQSRDYLADDEAALRQLQNQKDPFWKRAVIAGINAGQAGFGYQPTPIQTGRMRDMAKLQGQMGQEIKTGEARARIEQGQMVPVVLDSGETVMVPARTAGTVRSNQQSIGIRKQQETDRQTVNKARIGHWDSMDKERRHRLLADLYKSGGLNDPDQLQYAADELGIPGRLREKFIAGQMRDVIDENGNYGEMNRQTGAVTPSMNPRTEQPVKSYDVVKEQGRNRRATATLNERQREFNNPKPKSVAPEKLGEKTKQDIAKGYADYGSYRDHLTSIDDEIKQANDLSANWTRQDPILDKDGNEKGKKTVTKNEYLKELGDTRRGIVDSSKKRMAELNQLDPESEWGSGEQGYPYRKPKGAAAPSDLDRPIYGTPTGGNLQGAIDAFRRQAKREPNAKELANLKSHYGNQ